MYLSLRIESKGYNSLFAHITGRFQLCRDTGKHSWGPDKTVPQTRTATSTHNVDAFFSLRVCSSEIPLVISGSTPTVYTLLSEVQVWQLLSSQTRQNSHPLKPRCKRCTFLQCKALQVQGHISICPPTSFNYITYLFLILLEVYSLGKVQLRAKSAGRLCWRQ